MAWVPGSFELPVVAKCMAKSGQFDAVVAIGAVVSSRYCKTFRIRSAQNVRVCNERRSHRSASIQAVHRPSCNAPRYLIQQTAMVQSAMSMDWDAVARLEQRVVRCTSTSSTKDAAHGTSVVLAYMPAGERRDDALRRRSRRRDQRAARSRLRHGRTSHLRRPHHREHGAGVPWRGQLLRWHSHE